MNLEPQVERGWQMLTLADIEPVSSTRHTAHHTPTEFVPAEPVWLRRYTLSIVLFFVVLAGIGLLGWVTR